MKIYWLWVTIYFINHKITIFQTKFWLTMIGTVDWIWTFWLDLCITVIGISITEQSIAIHVISLNRPIWLILIEINLNWLTFQSSYMNTILAKKPHICTRGIIWRKGLSCHSFVNGRLYLSDFNIRNCHITFCFISLSRFHQKSVKRKLCMGLGVHNHTNDFQFRNNSTFRSVKVVFFVIQ